MSFSDVENSHLDWVAIRVWALLGAACFVGAVTPVIFFILFEYTVVDSLIWGSIAGSGAFIAWAFYHNKRTSDMLSGWLELFVATFGWFCFGFALAEFALATIQYLNWV